MCLINKLKNKKNLFDLFVFMKKKLLFHEKLYILYVVIYTKYKKNCN